jgi:tRNA U34 5-methylaminomethyl-2-thiouridine-forming methyltransferase MnmC
MVTDKRDCAHGQLARSCDLCDDAAEIARLRARVLELQAVHEDASGAVLQERERCAKLVEAMDTTGHDGYIETTGDLCEAIAARIRRA